MLCATSLKTLCPFSTASRPQPTWPASRRFAYSNKPLFPIEPKNLRDQDSRHKRLRRGRGPKGRRGIRSKAQRSSKPHDLTYEGGQTPYYKRFPRWPEAWKSEKLLTDSLEFLSLKKLRYFIEHGRLDARFPITQRHLRDSNCCRVKKGVSLFNEVDYPFPYRIDIEVADADQSSVDAIKKVGGTVTVVYRNALNLVAHLRPYKFEILPKTAAPPLEKLQHLEKLRARGCDVHYIKPQWMIEEEEKIMNELAEIESEKFLAEKGDCNSESYSWTTQQWAEWKSELLQAYRVRGLEAICNHKQQRRDS